MIFLKVVFDNIMLSNWVITFFIWIAGSVVCEEITRTAVNTTARNATFKEPSIGLRLMYRLPDSFEFILYIQNMHNITVNVTHNKIANETIPKEKIEDLVMFEELPEHTTKFVVWNLSPNTSYNVCVSVYNEKIHLSECVQGKTFNYLSYKDNFIAGATSTSLVLSVILLVMGSCEIYKKRNKKKDFSFCTTQNVNNEISNFELNENAQALSHTCEKS
ncbi:uncharacterized protein LOC143231922 [Tachypleus tridentatus]|uniref:uncharacterized protein LOC143231922 n=1 Tax=Tachypleus tridentatus TaxID=6853 RepID=UPI003FD1A9E7